MTVFHVKTHGMKFGAIKQFVKLFYARWQHFVIIQQDTAKTATSVVSNPSHSKITPICHTVQC